MRLEVETPSTLVDLGSSHSKATRGGSVLQREIREHDGVLHIGALAPNTEVAYHPVVTSRLPALSLALLSGASPQIRNMATVGGNVMQRTRCAYFRDVVSPCNKRQPGQGCGALDGYNRMHAVVGGSDSCIAVHPSDMCVAMAALDAVVHVVGPNGPREVKLVDFHTLPGARPDIETVLGRGELITEITIPLTPLGRHSTYVKVRDRSSYAFALVSVAAALEVRAGRIHGARLALGGVAPRPWRSLAAEKALLGQAAKRETFEKIVQVALAGAEPRTHNAFKLPLAAAAVTRAFTELAAEKATP